MDLEIVLKSVFVLHKQDVLLKGPKTLQTTGKTGPLAQRPSGSGDSTEERLLVSQTRCAILPKAPIDRGPKPLIDLQSLQPAPGVE